MTGSFQNDKGRLKKVDGSEEHLLGFLADGLHTSTSRNHVKIHHLASEVKDPFPLLIQNGQETDSLET